MQDTSAMTGEDKAKEELRLQKVRAKRAKRAKSKATKEAAKRRATEETKEAEEAEASTPSTDFSGPSSSKASCTRLAPSNSCDPLSPGTLTGTLTGYR